MVQQYPIEKSLPSDVATAASQLLRTGAVNYRVTGDVTVSSVAGNFTVPFSATGRYDTMRR